MHWATSLSYNYPKSVPGLRQAAAAIRAKLMSIPQRMADDVHALIRLLEVVSLHQMTAESRNAHNKRSQQLVAIPVSTTRIESR